MSDPFKEAIKDGLGPVNKVKKKPVERNVLKILENADAAEPDAVYSAEQLEEKAEEIREALEGLKKRLELAAYEYDAVSSELSKQAEAAEAVYNDMTYGQQHDLVGPGEEIAEMAARLKKAADVTGGLGGRFTEAVTALE